MGDYDRNRDPEVVTVIVIMIVVVIELVPQCYQDRGGDHDRDREQIKPRS